MEASSTNPKSLFSRFLITCLALTVALLSPFGEAVGQEREYATLAPNWGLISTGIPAGGSIENAQNAAIPDESFATLTSSRAVLGAASQDAWLQLKFPEPIAPDAMVFIKVSDIEEQGITLGLGSLLGAPNDFLSATLYQGATDGTEDSNEGNPVGTQVNSSFVRDAAGDLFLMVQALDNTTAFNSVRVQLTFPGGLDLNVVATRSVNIHYAFVLNGIDSCDPALFANVGQTTGVNVDLSQTVVNPHYAIDENTSNYSDVSLGLLSAGATASQTIHFPVLSEPNSVLNVRMQVNPAALNLNLAGAYGVRAYNGSVQVFEQVLSGGLIGGLDVLGLLGSGGVVSIPFEIPAPYDRVEVVLYSTLNLNVGAGLRLYGVSRTSASCPPPPPTPSPLIDPVCANSAIVALQNVDDAGNALDDNFDSYATIRSDAGVLIGLGDNEGYLEAAFDSPVPAGKTAYIRIDYDEDVLNSLLGGSLGGLLADLVNGIALGDHYFEVELTNGGAAVLSTSSADGFDSANGQVRLVQDKLGRYYIAIKTDSEYTNIRITDHTASALGVLAPEKYLNIYNICYENSEGACDPIFATDFDATGVSVDLGDIGGAGVINAHYAIDEDTTNNYSQINIGALGVGASIYQNVYFNTPSSNEDYLKIKLAIGNGSVLNADLISAIEVKAYMGQDEVFSKALSGGLINGVDVLSLLQSGETAILYFGPGVEFDRVSIGYNSLVSLNALSNSPIHLYYVQRYGPDCPDPNPIVVTPTDPMLLQRDCVTELLSFEHANFASNTVDGNNDTYATLEASSGILLGGVLGEAYSGHIELGFNGPVEANKTVYVRIDFDENQLSSLLDGSVGELLGGMVDETLFGNHYFTVEAKDGATTILERSSNSGFDDALGTGNGEVKIVQDKNGHYYVAVTSEIPFQSIRITEHLSALVGAGTIEHMNVYHACFSTGAELCEQAFSTYFETTGISLDLLGVGSAGVNNAHLAIDDNAEAVEGDETYSEIGIGTAGVGASTFQFVDFHTLSSPADYFKVKIGVESGSTLDVELLNNIEIRAYNGEELVYQQRLQNGLVAGLDILGLLSTENVVTIPIGPGKSFDRIAVGVSTLADVNALSTPVRLYSIKRFGADCPDPNPLPNNPETESPFNGPDCGVALGEFEHVNFAHNAIDGDIDTYATISAGSGVALGIGGYNGYIELGYDQSVPALETSYIRIDMPQEGLLDALVGGSLGSVLADVGDIVLFGSHNFAIEVRNADGEPITLDDNSSAGGFTGNDVRIVRDEFGRYYIAFTADQPYQSVRITLSNTAVAGLDAVTTMNVYSMCRETVFDPCEQATFTSFGGTGLTANLLEGANPAGVINPQYVIDGNTSNYAALSLGTASIGAAIYQDIYFKTKVTTTATDKVRLRIQVPQALLNVDLLGAYRVYLYNGDDEVYDATLQNALINGADLLGLLNSGGKVNVEFEPGVDVTYDRVRFEVSSVVGLGIGNPVRLYSVYRISDACPDPEFEPSPFSACADVIADGAENVDDIQNLTDGNHNSYATIRSDAGLVAGIGAYSGHVELGYSAVVPAGTSSYIRIGYEEEILSALLAGSLGGAVNDLLNGVALGDHYFNVIVKDENGTEVVSGSSEDLFEDANGQIRLVQDTKGRYYLEIRPTVAYQSVRLEDHTTALLGALSSEGHLDVYGMCHTPTTMVCPEPFSTSYEGSGLNVDALNLGGAGVQNAFWAIDENTSSASTLSLGTLSVLNNTIQQNVQFDRVLAAGDPIQITMKVGGGTLNVALLGALEIIGYLDGVEVYSESFDQAFVEANIVDLLNASEPANVTVIPDVDIDEIAFRLSNSASVGVAPNLSIYHIVPYCLSFVESSLEVTKDNAFADGVDYNEVTATVRNQDGDLMPNQEVIFTIINVDGTEITETISTNADGEAVLRLTSPIAGDASVTATVEGEPITLGSPAEVTFIIPNNLSITKVADEADGVTAGETTTFTVTITNDGPAPIAVGKLIPLNERPSEGLTITGYEVTSGNATATGTGNSATVTTSALIPVGGTITLTITADVAANAPVEVANGIDVWGPDRDPDTDTPDDNDDTDPIPVDRDYDFSGDNVLKAATEGEDAVAVAGEEFEYTVTITNGGPSTILSGTVLYLQDDPSDGQSMSGIVAGSANVSVSEVDGNGFFTVTATEDIIEGATFTLTVTADVESAIEADIVNNTINIWIDNPVTDPTSLPDPDGTDTTPDYPVDRDYGFDEPGAVVKVATDGTTAVATAGEAFSYTVTLTNMGSSTINANTVLYLQDVASAGQTISTITSNNGTVGTIGADGAFTLTVADAVAPNGTITLTVSVDVAADITANVVNNTINVWSEDPEGDYSSPEGTDTTDDYPVDRDYGFDDDAISKVGDAATATAGSAYTYTVTVENQGPSVILGGTALYLQDVVSAGQTITGITSASGAVGTIGADGEFTFTPTAAIAAGGTFSLTVTVDVDAAIVADIINNTINIWSEDPAGDYTTPEGTATTPDIPVDRDYGFDEPGAVVKVATDGTTAVATAGEAFSYTVTLTNMGSSTINANTVLYLQDVASAGQTISTITSNNGTVGTIGADGAFTLTVADAVAPNGTITLTVSVDVAADITANVVNNTINVWSEDPTEDPTGPEGTDTTPDYNVDRESNLTITKVAADDRVTAGQSTSFTLTITNNGPSAISAGEVINLGERPSAGLTITGYEVTSSNGTVAGTGNSAAVTTNSVIPVGGTITVSVAADVAADAPATIANGISVWGPDKDPENENPDDEDDTPEIPVDRVSNLSITKVPDDARVVAGESTSFTLTIMNDGPSVIASGAVISLGERPSAGLSITGYEVTSGNGQAVGSGNSATVTTNAVIPVGGTITVVVTADVSADAPSTITNGVDVWGPDKDPENDTPDDGDDTPEIPVDRNHDLTVTKVADQDRVTAGEVTTFTITVTNNGPSTIASGELIELRERPGTGVTITNYEVASGNGTIAGSGNAAAVTTTAVIPAGGTVVVKVTATVDADAPSSITNGISVWGPDKDPENENPDDEDDTPEIPVNRVSNIGIAKVADQARVRAGTATTFTLTVTNNGPSVIESGKAINLTERPGEGVTITGYEVTGGAATVAGNGNTAVLTTTDKIAVGGTITVKVAATVDANAPATITNGISVWGPDKDPENEDPDDEDDTPEIPVDPNSTLSIVKVADQARVKAGENTTFTLTITNEGPSPVANGATIQLTERPGEGVTVTGYEITSGNATVSGSGNEAAVTTTATIPAGGTITVKVNATIAGDAEGTITNGISVWGPGKNPATEDPDDEDDTPEVPVDPSYALSIAKVADQEQVISGGATSFTVTITNNGPSAIASGKIISLEERPGSGVTVTGYEVTSDNASVAGSGNAAELTTTRVIPNGGTITVVVSADVTAAPGSTITNGIAVWGPDKNPDTDEEDDEDQTPEVPVERPYALSVEKEADQSLVTAGQPTTFTVTVTNNGPLEIPAGNPIALEERPGAGVTITGYEVIAGDATVSGTGNSATLTTTGAISVGETIVVRITATVAPTATGTVTNGIAVWAPDRSRDTEDPDDEDNSDPVPVDATLEIPNLFTPNGDGLNDQFVIRNLLQYQNRELLILNRWGNQVYKSTNYNNDWDGGSLAEGTYYYILRVRGNDGGDWQTHKGAVALIRVTSR